MKNAVYRIERSSSQWWMYAVQRKFLGGVWVTVRSFNRVVDAEQYIKECCCGLGYFAANGNRI